MNKYICFIIGCLLSLMTCCAHAQKNLVTNGGFEDDMYGWNNSNNIAKNTPWDIKEGKSSCAIITANADNWMGIDQIIRIPKKVSALEVSAWTKAINVVKNKDEWNGAIFTIEFLDKQDKKLGDGVNLVRVTGDQPWTLSKQNIRIPAGAVSFRILLAMGYASGAMLIDDVKAIAVSDDVKS